MMAVHTTYSCEGGASLFAGWCGRSWSWRSKHPCEVSERLDVRDNGGVRSARGCGSEVLCVVGSWNEQAAWRFIALLGEKLVRDAHLDVAGLGGEHEKRFVLRLPSETCNGSIIGAAVHISAEDGVRMSGDAHRRFLACVALHVGQDRGVGNRLNQSVAKKRSRDSKDDVPISALASERIPRRQEVELCDVATGSIRTASNHEQCVHIAIGGAVHVLEACFAYRTVFHDEPWHPVLRSIQSSHRQQRVLRRARSASGRLRV